MLFLSVVEPHSRWCLVVVAGYYYILQIEIAKKFPFDVFAMYSTIWVHQPTGCTSYQPWNLRKSKTGNLNDPWKSRATLDVLSAFKLLQFLQKCNLEKFRKQVQRHPVNLKVYHSLLVAFHHERTLMVSPWFIFPYITRINDIRGRDWIN